MITVDRWRKGKQGVYIGRAMPRQGLRASPLGNPYKLAHKDDPREPVLERYRVWLQAHLYPDSPQSLEIARLTELARTGDLVLLCWCKENGIGPACHGDVVKAIIEERLSNV